MARSRRAAACPACRSSCAGDVLSCGDVVAYRLLTVMHGDASIPGCNRVEVDRDAICVRRAVWLHLDEGRDAVLVRRMGPAELGVAIASGIADCVRAAQSGGEAHTGGVVRGGFGPVPRRLPQAPDGRVWRARAGAGRGSVTSKNPLRGPSRVKGVVPQPAFPSIARLT